MAPDLTQARARVDRATDLLLAFTEIEGQWASATWFQQKTYLDSSEHEDPTLVDLVICPDYPDTPAEWPFLVSDIVQNARIALEYAAYQLCQVGSRPRETNTSWPILDREPDPLEPVGNKRSGLYGVDEHFLRVIESRQPYHDPHPRSHPFSLLRDLSNVDKHRQLTVSYSTIIPFLSVPLPDREQPGRLMLYPDIHSLPDFPELEGATLVNADVAIAGQVSLVGGMKGPKGPGELFRQTVRTHTADPSDAEIRLLRAPWPSVTFGDPSRPCDTNRILTMVSAVSEAITALEAAAEA